MPRKKDWADDEVETDLYPLLTAASDDQAVLDKVATMLRRARVEGYEEGVSEGRKTAFKYAFRGGFGRSVVPG